MKIKPSDIPLRVEIQKPVQTDGDLGELTTRWVEWCRVWAGITPIGARELEFARSICPSATHKVRIRYVPNLLSTYRIKFGVRILSIDGVIDPDEAKFELNLYCTEKKVKDQA